MAGIMMGALIMPTIADMVGRKLLISVGLVAMFIFSTMIVFLKSFVAFLIMRFFAAVLISGSFLSLYVLSVEWFAPRQRAFVGAVIWVPWVAGYCTLPLAGYFIHNWRHLQLVLSIPIAVVFCFPWLLPESVHWLVSQNKLATAEALVQEAAKTNGITLPERFSLTAPEKSSEHRKKTLWDVLHTPLLRVYAVMMCFLWFANSLVYYGLTFGAATWAGNVWGRQRPICAFHLIAGIPLLILPFLPQKTADGRDLATLRTVLNIIGKFGISSSFCAIYLFASELYPTVVRSAGIGISSVFARIGGIIAPYLANSIGILEPKAPPLIFALLAIVSAVFSMIIPETSQLPLMSSLEDSRFLSKSYRDAHLLIAQQPRETSVVTEGTDEVQPSEPEPIFSLHNNMQANEDPTPMVFYQTSV
ncbi:PREDICTED: organic cation transporter protein-like isoform X2 [Priapulus caudatus]|uniref:Organic cation transporter protein-like isoform X2 n=1 Tax=Priapulus caudatus TaxID=37621 RepID=A0ABM1E6E1_PRICU|nr:PREDICTED: organic cation transporter protein-like isoform X2 [Priapulus caudatus]